LGQVDLEEKTLQPLDRPFGPKVLPMWSVRSATKLWRNLDGARDRGSGV